MRLTSEKEQRISVVMVDRFVYFICRSKGTRIHFYASGSSSRVLQMNNDIEDVPSSNQPAVGLKAKKKGKKGRSEDLTCVICHGAASGFNFTQISCRSCKGMCASKNYLNRILVHSVCRILSSHGSTTYRTIIFATCSSITRSIFLDHNEMHQ